MTLKEVRGISSWLTLSEGFLTYGHEDLEQRPCSGGTYAVLAEEFWEAGVGWRAQGVLGMGILSGPRKRG